MIFIRGVKFSANQYRTRVRKDARGYFIVHPIRSRSMFYCKFLALVSVYCYLCFATSTPSGTAAAVFRSRVIIPMTAFSMVGLLCASWSAADGWDNNANTTTEALDLRIASALSLLEKSSRVEEHEASAIGTRGEAELLDITEGYPWYAPAQFYLGLMSQTRGDFELAVDFYSAALRAGCRWCMSFSERAARRVWGDE